MIITVIISQDILYLFKIFSYQEGWRFMNISMLLNDDLILVYFNNDFRYIELYFVGNKLPIIC